MVPEDMTPANVRDVLSATRKMVAEDDSIESTNDEALTPRVYADPRASRTGAVNWGRMAGMAFLILALGGGAAWVYINFLAPKEEAEKPAEAELPEVQPVLVPDYLSSSADYIDRVRPTPESSVVQRLPRPEVVRAIPESSASRSDLLNRDLKGDEIFELLGPDEAPTLPRESLPTVSISNEKEPAGVRPPGARLDEQMAYSPSTKLKNGLNKAEYWTALQNQLLLRNEPGQPEGSQIDLEKAWILLSLYYKNDTNVEEIRSTFSRLAAELYNRVVVVDSSTGEAEMIADEAEVVRIIINFLLNGDGASGGWDVQEYHPGIRNMGTPPYRQNYLVHQIFDNPLASKNKASNTALNLLALVLLRKISHDLDGDGKKLGINVPLYGMRLPDRTVLRYDARGANAILLSKEERARNEIRSFNDLSSDTKIDPDYRGFTRNIELIRNGNHYDAEEYRRRYQISEVDGEKGIYLRTLSDRRMFASLGYELAMADLQQARLLDNRDIAQAEVLYDRAQKFLTEWVLDEDIGAGTNKDKIEGKVRKRLYAPTHAQPRGDLLLRDAHILLAELYLQRANYKAIETLIENDYALATDGERAETLGAMIKASKGAIEGARASFRRVMEFDRNNPHARYYLGLFDFLAADASLPAIYRWKPANEVQGLDAIIANDLNSDIDKLSSAIKHWDVAEQNDLGRLNGKQRFTMHLHRALAYEQRGDSINAIADLQRVGEIDPNYANSPNFESIDRRLRFARVFEILEGRDANADGQLMYDAVAYLDKNLTLSPELQYELEATVRALGSIKNIAIQWELVGVLKRVTGKNFGRTPTLWKNWISEHFKRSGVQHQQGDSRVYARAFRVVSGSSKDYDQIQKEAAVAYLQKNLALNHDNRVNIERTVDALAAFDSRSVQPALLSILQDLTGQKIGNDPDSWRRWLNDYFRRNP